VTDAEKREKVIFALRYCRENMCGPECPYYYDDINESPADCVMERIAGDALALLKDLMRDTKWEGDSDAE